MKPSAKKLLTAFTIIAAGIGAAIIHRLSGTICLFKTATGIPCPGCGMTRAWAAALRGDFTGALEWHPLFAAAPVLAALTAVYIFAKKPRMRKIAEIALIVMCVTFIAVWIVRLIGGWR